MCDFLLGEELTAAWGEACLEDSGLPSEQFEMPDLFADAGPEEEGDERSERPGDRRRTPEEELGLVGRSKQKAPPLGPEWQDPRRYRIVISGRWSRPEHNNVLELRTVVNLGRHLGRAKESCGHKYLVFVDSLVALGCLGKGRSSSPPLLALCRDLGYGTRFLDEGRRLLELSGQGDRTHRTRLEDHPDVVEVVSPGDSYELHARGEGRPDTVVEIGKVSLGGGNVAIAAGPCSVEDYERLLLLGHNVHGGIPQNDGQQNQQGKCNRSVFHIIYLSPGCSAAAGGRWHSRR